MIESVKLHNFRKHTFLEVFFEDGLNVIRAPSEGGKTTILEAISYCYWGTKALRTSLADTVTYGQPETTLKVIQVLNLDGVKYTITRSKSGAEILYADQSVTGQTECTKFMERLFRCSSDIASKLLFADQNSVRGILSEGATAADGLVNTLSELNTLETLIDKVQTQLPSGNTGAVESQIKMLQESKQQNPEVPSEAAVTTAEAEFSSFSEKIDLLERAVPGDQAVADAGVAVTAFNAAQARIAKIVPFLGGTVTPARYTAEQLAEFRDLQANSAEEARRRKAYAAVFPACSVEWDDTAEALTQAIANTEVAVTLLNSQASKLAMEINTATVLRINEKTCAFCKKDLTDVPEVIAINLESDELIIELGKKLKAITDESIVAAANKKAYAEITKVTAQIKALAGDYWSLSDAAPPVPTWKGAVPEAETAQVDVAAFEKELRVYQAEMTKRELLEIELEELEVITFIDVDEDLALIKEHKLAKEAVAAMQAEQVLAARAVREAKIRYSAAVTAYDLAVAQIAKQTVQLEALQKTYADMLKHNSLVKKLRVVRPQIAAQLWGSVLAATSQYFSMIRGTNSVVSRDAKGFKVDGRGIKGLSGSTLDALGLAIRMSLSKLFLPGVPLLVLDEAFAGAEPSRELAGISTIASAGFSQVLFITHSDAPEAIADNLIEL